MYAHLLFASAIVCALSVTLINTTPLKPVEAGKCAPPDGTDKQLFWRNCYDGPIVVNSLTLETDNKSVYPIDLRKKLILKAVSVNKANITYNTLNEDVDISYYTSLFSACHFKSLVKFSQTSCGNCPLKPGPLILDYPIDLSSFGWIIDLLGNGSVVQINVTMKNGDSSVHEEIGCITLEGMVGKSPDSVPLS